MSRRSGIRASCGRSRPATARSYRDALDHVLLPRFAKTRLVLIDPDEIAALVRDLEREGLHAIDPARPVRPLGHSSCVAALKPLRQVLTHAARRGLIATNPFTLLTKEDRPVHDEERPMHEWTTAEVSSLIAASQRLAATPDSPMDWTPLLRVAVTLGLRIGEITGCQWRDLWKNERGDYVLHIQRQWLSTGQYGPTKTKAGNREIAVPSDLAGDLLALKLRSRFSGDECPVFAGATGQPLAHRTVTRRGWAPARDAAELPSSLTFHSTRHACASRLIDAGLDPVTVASVLGHEDPSITLKIYAARFDRQKKDDAVREALAGIAVIEG